MEGLVCSAWINWNKVFVVRFRKESMQKSVPVDAADMRTVKKIQIFPHYRVDPHNFGKEWNWRGRHRVGQKNLLKW